MRERGRETKRVEESGRDIKKAEESLRERKRNQERGRETRGCNAAVDCWEKERGRVTVKLRFWRIRSYCYRRE